MDEDEGMRACRTRPARWVLRLAGDRMRRDAGGAAALAGVVWDGVAEDYGLRSIWIESRTGLLRCKVACRCAGKVERIDDDAFAVHVDHVQVEDLSE